jgi:hypothetical protein
MQCRYGIFDRRIENCPRCNSILPRSLMVVFVVAILLVCIFRSRHQDSAGSVTRQLPVLVPVPVVGVVAWTLCTSIVSLPRNRSTRRYQRTCQEPGTVTGTGGAVRKLLPLSVLRSTNDENHDDPVNARGGNTTASARNDDMNDVNVVNDCDDVCDINDTKCLFNEMEETIDPKRKQEIRMHIVRSIQNSFYSTSTSTSTVTPFNNNNDIIGNDGDKTRIMGDTRARADNGTSNDVDSTRTKPWDVPVSSSTTTVPVLDEDYIQNYERHHSDNNIPTVQNNGMIERLPLWRVPWTEVIGRTNVLFVHDAIYTNMFEQIIREHERNYNNKTNNNNDNNYTNQQQQQSPPPLLFGHVYLPFNGNKNTGSNQIEYKLQSWQDYHHQSNQLSTTETTSSLENIMDHTSVIGTLMKINDYRRMNDGKLILYVQGIERFVIQHVHQIVPYGIVQVQLLPDIEEFGKGLYDIDSATVDTTTTDMIPLQYSTSQYTLQNITNHYSYTEDIVRPKRTTAIVTESWKTWFPYEYSSSIGLPIPSSSLSMSDIVGCALAKVVPFAPFDIAQYPIRLSSESKPESERTTTFSTVEQITSDNNKNTINKIKYRNQSTQLPIEIQLLQAGIYIESEILQMIPMTIQKITSIDELERRLWIALNQYYIKSKSSISPYILSLLPPLSILAESWPKGFLLEGIANVMERTATAIGRNSFRTTRHSNDTNNNVSQMNNTLTTSQLQQQRQIPPITNKGSINFVRVPVTYPSLRRQKRCSYYIGQILESFNVDQVQSIRQTLLRIPTTRLRLAYILSLLEIELDSLSED